MCIYIVSWPSIKGLLTGLGLCSLNQLCGGFVIVNYATTIFESSGSPIDANLSTIILGSVQLVGTYISTILIDRIGRKKLLLSSFFGMAIGFLCNGTYSYLVHNETKLNGIFHMIPVIFMPFVLFSFSLGLQPVPFLILVEILPEKVGKIFFFSLIHKIIV